MKKIISVVGARPNFVKIAPLHRALLPYQDQIAHLICHTGQHFDQKMSDVFFKELGIPEPTFNLEVSGGSHAQQTARIMMAFEEIIIREKPDLIVVPGDVNSTLACSLVASKIGIKLAHIESGLRSYNRQMPEEINRIVTDVLADFLFVSEPSGLDNLEKEGIDSKKVFFVGNIMIDTLVMLKARIEKECAYIQYGLDKKNYVLVTFHRPSNVDDPQQLKELLKMLSRLSDSENVVFPIHPRTRKNIDKLKYNDLLNSRIMLTEPIGYLSFLSLIQNAKLVMTDSGGIQEECTFLHVPCITAREDTERPITIDAGTNYLGSTDFKKLDTLVLDVLTHPKTGRIPELWDGKTAERIVEILVKTIL